MSNVGINVVEVDGRATPSIQAAPTSVAAFVVRSRRGVPGKVHRVTSFRQFTDRFGSYMDDAYGAYAVDGFFENGGAVAYVTRLVKTDGTTPAAAASETFTDSDDADALVVTAGFRGSEDPGAWGETLAIRITDNESVTGTYDLEVRLAGTVVETWERLNVDAADSGTGRDAEAAINDELTGSRYITVSVPDAADANPEATDPSTDEGFVALVNGDDDQFTNAGVYTTWLNNNVEPTLSLFDVHQVQLVSCPETTSPTVQAAGMSYCKERGDCMYVGFTPQGLDVAGAKTYVSSNNLRGDKVYGALYFPWIRVNDPIGTYKWIPPVGHAMGVYARTERERGVWKAPAGNAARLEGPIDVGRDITDADHTDLVKNGGVNAVRSLPGLGIVLDSSRTLSTNPLWLYVNVRLLFNFVKTSLKTGLRWVVQEPNTDELWNKIKFNTVRPFLMGLWRRGAFGPGAPEDVFTVKCDEDNNPPANIQQGILTVEVYFYPSRPAETIVLTIGQQEGGASASES